MKKLTQNEKIQSIEKSGLRKKEKKKLIKFNFFIEKVRKSKTKNKKNKIWKIEWN